MLLLLSTVGGGAATIVEVGSSDSISSSFVDDLENTNIGTWVRQLRQTDVEFFVKFTTYGRSMRGSDVPDWLYG